MNRYLKLFIDNAARGRQPVRVENSGDASSIYIYDVIDKDFGVSAMSVLNAINEAGAAKTLNIYINSPGGDVFESRAIMTMLSRFDGETVAHIDGICASAATSIALSCGRVNMSDTAFFMIHNASGFVWGTAQDMRDTADVLDKVESAIVEDYTKKTGKPACEIQALMDAETWMTAKDALDNGFVDCIVSTGNKAKNTWNLSAFEKAPKELTEPEAPEHTPQPEIDQSRAAINRNRLRLAELV